jgi:hypothetical protein
MCRIVIGTTGSVKVQNHMTHGMPRGGPRHPGDIIMPHHIHYFGTSGLRDFGTLELRSFQGSGLHRISHLHTPKLLNCEFLNTPTSPPVTSSCHVTSNLLDFENLFLPLNHKPFLQSVELSNFQTLDNPLTRVSDNRRSGLVLDFRTSGLRETSHTTPQIPLNVRFLNRLIYDTCPQTRTVQINSRVRTSEISLLAA